MTLRMRILACLTVLLLIGAFAQGRAQTVVDRIDHYQTGFPLEGRHEEVACDACHVNSVFAGTPRRCADCHNNVVAQGKTIRHIPITDACETCHSTRDWLTQRFDHTSVYSDCVTCHNNFLAPGKNARHPPTNNICEDCHNTIHWNQIRPTAMRRYQRAQAA
jgi:hypothetical protein